MVPLQCDGKEFFEVWMELLAKFLDIVLRVPEE